MWRQWVLHVYQRDESKADRPIIKIFWRPRLRERERATPPYFTTYAGLDDKERAGMPDDRITETFMLSYVDHTHTPLWETSYPGIV